MTPADLRTTRATLSLSQSQLAAALGCSVSSLQDWEQGRIRIPRWVPKSLASIKKIRQLEKNMENRPFDTAPCGCRVYGNWFDGSTHYEPWVDESQCDGSCRTDDDKEKKP
jgi:transcriptional regulator with XRE-family HTH domain